MDRVMRARDAQPPWWPARFYYGWALVGTLGITVAVSYGILWYAFSAFISPMSTELGWTRTQITGGFSCAQLVAGVAAIPVGRWVDRYGARALMTAGSALAAVILAAWAGVHGLAAYYVLMAGLGVALAAVLYEPAFAVIATWFRRDRGKALTLLTFMAGFASVIFVPLATYLVGRYGWRTALLVCAAIMAVLTVLPHLIVLRRRPADLGLAPDGVHHETLGRESGEMPGAVSTASAISAEAMRSPVFRWLTVSYALSALTTTAVCVHLVPLLLERGYSSTFAGAAVGVLGLMGLPGRLAFATLDVRWSRSIVAACMFASHVLAAATLLVSRGTIAVWVFVVLFGAGLGAITPARAALVAELFGHEHYGRISGVLALFLSLARAAAPVGASLLHTWGSVGRGYDVVMAAVLILCLGSAVTILLAGEGAKMIPAGSTRHMAECT